MNIKLDHMVENPPFPRNYAAKMLVVDRGEGTRLYDEAGKEYLDFGAGISVNALGYGREDLAEAMENQARRLIHTSNLYAHRPGLDLARRLLDSAPFPATKPMAAVQFGNSGAEANEAAMKYARLYARKTKGPGHHKILSFSGGFHGRTMGALSATPKPKYKTPFEPLVPGMVTTEFNDVRALERTLSREFAAVIVEVVQGEGGLSVMSREFADAIGRLAGEHDVMVIADEVQTGLGRTGRLYAAELVDLEADIITLAKPLAAGLPLSATLIPAEINDALNVGDHGTTFGGGPVTTAVALRVFDVLSDSGFLAEVERKGVYLRRRLAELSEKLPLVGRVLGHGLLAGIEVGESEDATTVGKLMGRCQDAGLLVLKSGVNALRLAPPLIVTEAEIDEAVSIIQTAMTEIEHR